MLFRFYDKCRINFFNFLVRTQAEFFTLDSNVKKKDKTSLYRHIEKTFSLTFQTRIHCNDNQTEHFVHHNVSLITQILI